MHLTRAWLTGFALAATLAMSGCLCGADEERAVTVSSIDSLVVARDGPVRRVGVVTRLTEAEASAPRFAFVFNTLEGSSGGEGIALTLSGLDPATDEVVLLVLALPVSLRRGDTYVVGATFSVDAGVPSEPRLWGPHDLQQPNQAEAAFTIARYTFPPGEYRTTFRAASTSGTVRVTDRRDGSVALQLDLTLTDDAGKTTTLSGRAQANSERYTPPCT